MFIGQNSWQYIADVFVVLVRRVSFVSAQETENRWMSGNHS